MWSVLWLVASLQGCRSEAPESPAPPPGDGAPAPVAIAEVAPSAPPAAELQIGGVPASTLPDVAERVVRSVVSVGIQRRVEAHRDPFRGPHQGLSEGLGSGVILSADGVVLTNHHVVEDAERVRVSLNDGRVLDASVVGSDPKTDVAVLRIDAPPADLVPVELGDSDALRLGEVVLAVGNPFGVGQTVTMGIVSALGRADLGLVDYEDFIQTDAAINPGNSGGALVDLRGRLVGVNTAIYSRSGGSQGIGFAIPIARARRIADSILANGHVTRGFLGVSIQDVDARIAEVMSLPPGGVLVSDVAPQSPADEAGFRAGDVVVELDGKPVQDVARFRYEVASAGPGATFSAVVLRDGERHTLNGRLGDADRPAEQEAAGLVGGARLEPLTEALRREADLPPRIRGLYVRDAGDGPLARAGVHAGDVVLDVDRVPGDAPAALQRQHEAGGGPVLRRLNHQGDVRFVVVEPGR